MSFENHTRVNLEHGKFPTADPTSFRGAPTWGEALTNDVHVLIDEMRHLGESAQAHPAETHTGFPITASGLQHGVFPVLGSFELPTKLAEILPNPMAIIPMEWTK